MAKYTLAHLLNTMPHLLRQPGQLIELGFVQQQLQVALFFRQRARVVSETGGPQVVQHVLKQLQGESTGSVALRRSEPTK